MIVVVDYGMGNTGSIINMLNRIGAEALVSSESSDINKADKLILAGIGAFDSAMKNISDTRLVSVLQKRVMVDKIPILGICLGMQLMTKKSQEGKISGFGWLDADTVMISFNGIKIPHMGWDIVKIRKNNKDRKKRHSLMRGKKQGEN